jgi:hypothetical protein
LDETWVYIERVIAYWSRVLKQAEQNYLPMEREALALKEGLIKFQPYIEGKVILVITDHAALTWSKTFQNVNRQLGNSICSLSKIQIVHRASRVHSNVDPISRLRCRVPHQQGPTVDATQHISLDINDDPLRDMYSKLGEKFKEKLLNVASKYINSNQNLPDYSHLAQDVLELMLSEGESLVQDYTTSNTYSVLIGMDNEGLESWKRSYATDQFYSKVLNAFHVNNNKDENYPQYQLIEGLIYFEDCNGNLQLCVSDSLHIEVMSEVHNVLTESAHRGHTKTYNRIASTYYWPKMS